MFTEDVGGIGSAWLARKIEMNLVTVDIWRRVGINTAVGKYASKMFFSDFQHKGPIQKKNLPR